MLGLFKRKPRAKDITSDILALVEEAQAKPRIAVGYVAQAYETTFSRIQDRLKQSYTSPEQKQQNLKELNELTRLIPRITILYSYAPEAFTGERVRKAADLIDKAAEYALNSDYWFNIADRKEAFYTLLRNEKEVHKSQKFINRTISKNAVSLDTIAKEDIQS